MSPMEIGNIRKGKTGVGMLGGQMLVAMPGMRDQRFRNAVIYMCAHSADGAMGIIVNQRAQRMTFRDLLLQLDLLEPEQAIRLPRRVSHAHVLRGGPVETSRGFVLHTPDFIVEASTQRLTDDVALTATLDILKAIARQEGPRASVLALGYSGWSAGQLESELATNGWLHCEADHELIFGTNTETKYERALGKIGIDPAMLSSEVGRA
ncbi:MAG: YqgE/AlgH family protein [Beijerinckiaceae bacterium]